MAIWSEWEDLSSQFNFGDIFYQKKYRREGGGVARLLVNRPKSMNAFTTKTMREITRATHEATFDPYVGVIVVSGVGQHFGTGGDVTWEAEGGLDPDSDVWGGGGWDALTWSSKPTIAMVKGYCIGGSHHLAYHCDLTIAADTAILGQNGPRVGSTPAGRPVGQLAHIVGIKRAKEIWMLCRQYTAQEALAFGLVNAVVPLERLEEEVDQWCDELLNLCPTPLAMVKFSLEAVGGYLAQESGRIPAMINPQFDRSEEAARARKAFFERTIARHWPLKEDAKWPAEVLGQGTQ